MPNIQTNHAPLHTSPPIRRDDIRFDDLIERQPGWLLRSGIPLIFFAVVVFLGLAGTIHYPDRLAAPFILTTENPPIELVAHSGGQIEAIYWQEGQLLEKGAEVMYLDNPANLADVQTFAQFVDSLSKIKDIPDYLNLAIPEDLQLGELRQTYTEYAQTLTTFQYVLRQGIVFQKIQALDEKINKQQQLTATLQKQLALFEKELALSEKDYRRNAELHRQGVVSDLDLEKNETQYLRQQQQHEAMKTAIIHNSVEIAQLRTDQLSLKDERAKAVSGYIIRLNELALRFRNEHNEWRKKYFLHAPIAGVLSLSPGVALHQTVKAGDVLASVVPSSEKGNSIVARIYPPAGGIGKAELGNRVLLRLDAFPYKEFGHLEAKIDAISSLPTKDKEGQLFYEITCRLPDTLVSSIGKLLPFRQRLTGTAQIITKDRSVLRRLLDRLLSLNS
jgi:multidrug efflux pump subunit AcrA (membrane-fusion protein)